MVAAATPRHRPYRRRVLVIGVGAAALVAAAGTPWYVARVEHDLEQRVEAAAAGAGLAVTVTASGQDVRLTCSAALDDPQAAADAAATVRGVRGIAVDRSCRVDEPTGSGGTATASEVGAATTSPDTPAAGTGTSTATTSPPTPAVPAETAPTASTGAPAPATVSAPAPAVESVRAVLDDGQLQLEGTVASDVQHLRLVEGASRHLDLANVTDELVVDPAAGVDDSTVQAFAELVAVMPGNLADGTATAGGDGLSVTGTYVDDDGRSAVDAVGGVVDADVALTPRPAATAADAATITDQLGELLAASPIEFEPLSATMSGSSAGVLDRIAGTLAGLSALHTTIEGHTDSTGTFADNLVLGEQRAQAVLVALVERGVPANELDAVGRGEAEPVLVDGVEDPVASRRVVLLVDRTGAG
jgi:OmpA-OmpF porin, OOP family